MRLLTSRRASAALIVCGLAIVGFLGACSDNGEAPTAGPDVFMANLSTGPGEGQQLDTVVIEACEPPLEGEYPNCYDPCYLNPYGPSCQEPDPCEENPFGPGCGDPCTINPLATGCDDPCSFDPSAPDCGSCDMYPDTCYPPDGGDDLSTPPPGVDYLDWAGLNDDEKRLCRAAAVACAGALTRGKEALNWAAEKAQQAGQGAHNNIYDAMRHAYWQALLTRDFGDTYAKAWGDAHELPTDPAGESCMDQHNNSVGRQIGNQHGSWASNGTLRQAVENAPLQASPGC